MKIEQEVCAIGTDFHGHKNFDLGEASERHGNTTSESEKEVDPKLGNTGLQSNIKRMLGM